MSSQLSDEHAREAASQALAISIVKSIVVRELENRTNESREVLMQVLDGYDWRLLQPPPEASQSRQAFESFIKRTVDEITRSLEPSVPS